MTTPEYSITDESFRKNNPESYALTMQLTESGVSYCLKDLDTDKNVMLVSYPFPAANSDRKADFLSELLQQQPWLHKTALPLILINSDKFTLIPTMLFNVSEKELYLRFNCHPERGEDIFSDKLLLTDAYSAYALPKNTRANLLSQFPDAKIVHFSSCLIESLLRQFRNQEKTQVFANIHHKSFDLLIIEQRKLKFFNSFCYQTRDDFIYFLLFVMEQLSLNPESIPVHLLGEIEKESEIFEMAYKYIRNACFVERNNMQTYSYVFDRIPGHFFYNLLNARLCAL